MKPEIKEQWVEALLSGKYKQGQRRLRDNRDRFCCLGVLCDIVDPESWKLIQWGSGEAWHHEYKGEEGFYAVLPSWLREDVGVSNENRLISMNDDGSTFQEIAEYIRENE